MKVHDRLGSRAPQQISTSLMKSNRVVGCHVHEERGGEIIPLRPSSRYGSFVDWMVLDHFNKGLSLTWSTSFHQLSKSGPFSTGWHKMYLAKDSFPVRVWAFVTRVHLPPLVVVPCGD